MRGDVPTDGVAGDKYPDDGRDKDVGDSDRWRADNDPFRRGVAVLDELMDDGLYLSSNADGCLVIFLLPDPGSVDSGVMFSEVDLTDGGVWFSADVRFDRETRAALDARMRGLSGGFDDVDDER